MLPLKMLQFRSLLDQSPLNLLSWLAAMCLPPRTLDLQSLVLKRKLLTYCLIFDSGISISDRPNFCRPSLGRPGRFFWFIPGFLPDRRSGCGDRNVRLFPPQLLRRGDGGTNRRDPDASGELYSEMYRPIPCLL